MDRKWRIQSVRYGTPTCDSYLHNQLVTMTFTLNITRTSSVLFGALCVASGFSLIHDVPEWQITGRWIGSLAVAALGLFVVSTIKLLRPGHGTIPCVRTCSMYMATVNIAVVVYCLMQLASLARNSTPFRAVADFDNPAGVAALLCVTFPFSTMATAGWRSSRIIAVALLTIDSVVLFMIQSRSGLSALAATALTWVVCGPRGAFFFKAKRLVMVLLLVAAATGGLVFLSYHKKASTYGRMVILSTCMRMVADRPLLGHGPHGFEREYMLSQAEFLKGIEDENILMLSDNVTHPLSEYMLVAVDYGLTGLSVVIAIIICAVVGASRRCGRTRVFLFMEFCSVCTLSLFSYPFRYPMTWVALVCCFVPELIIWAESCSLTVNKIVWSATLVLSVFTLLSVGRWHMVQAKWKNITDRLNSDTGAAMTISREMLPLTDAVLSGNPRYLYSRAVVNYYAAFYDQALADAKGCAAMLSSYDTELLLGSVCQKMRKFHDAESHYMVASYMCPSRITPLYRLFRLYEEQGDSSSMVEIGRRLLDKPVKIQSRETRAMRLDVRRTIEQ